jgi:uncharacterized protein
MTYFHKAAIQILDVLKKHFPTARILLFGSRASGKNRPGSDIDIAIDEGSTIAFGRMSDARLELDEMNIPYKIDLVDIYSVSKTLAEEIRKKGREWTV